jgi:hypothetical protein
MNNRIAGIIGLSAGGKMISVNIYYTGKNSAAREFVREMISGGTVDEIRSEKGNLRYEYFFSAEDEETVLLVDAWQNQSALDFHHDSPAMKKIASLREKFGLTMKVERFVTDENGIPESDEKFIVCEKSAEKNFRKMRRFRQELSADETKNLLKKIKRASFSVNGDGGYPYTIPVDFYYDEKENCIYFHSAKEGHKIDSVKKNEKVCFTSWDDGYREEGDWAFYVSSCVVFGTAELVSDEKIAREKIRLMALKYYPTEKEADDEIQRDMNRVQMIRIKIEHMSGKKIHEK